jgi:hypothetical protein
MAFCPILSSSFNTSEDLRPSAPTTGKAGWMKQPIQSSRALKTLRHVPKDWKRLPDFSAHPPSQEIRLLRLTLSPPLGNYVYAFRNNINAVSSRRGTRHEIREQI